MIGADVGQGLRTSLRTFTIFFDLFAGGGFLFSLEFLDPAELIDETHFTGKEGVTLGTDIHGKVGLGGTGCKLGTTATGDGNLIVFGVDRGFHEGYCNIGVKVEIERVGLKS